MNHRRSRTAGIVLALLVPGVNAAGVTGDGLSSEERQVTLDMMQTAMVLEVAAEQLGQYPDSDGRLVRLDSMLELGAEPFRKRFQTKDPWGAHYLYWSEARDYVVISPGFNGRLDVDRQEIETGIYEMESGDDLIISRSGWVRKPLSMRERQRVTMADLRSLGTAIEEYSIDNNFYPDLRDSTDFIYDLARHVAPMYIRRIPTEDGWSNRILGWSGPHGMNRLPVTGSELDSPPRPGRRATPFRGMPAPR